LTASGWLARPDGRTTVLTLTSDWTSIDATFETAVASKVLDRAGLHAISFETSGLTRWDSSLLVFVSGLRRAASQRAIDVDESGLPAAARGLLALLAAESAPTATIGVPTHRAIVERLGRWVIAQTVTSGAISELVGEQLLRTAAWVRGRAKTRSVDVLTQMRSAGLAALPMVALVNLMVGGILAFVGVVQLRRFGASVYVADLVGVGVVREMAPLMTGIVMSGRTGTAYAAELATMQGSEQTDALRAFGIPLYDYLILPRVSALTAMMPALYLYASAIGIGGGFAVAVIMLKLSPEAFVSELRGAITGTEILFGLTKSVIFGAWIGMTGCRIGLAAGRSSNDVGDASTRAAVTGIAGVIVLDAVFAACANAWGI
jgi:phospholipid/cholesterol/gamma-HCH transport system permease protein